MSFPTGAIHAAHFGLTQRDLNSIHHILQNFSSTRQVKIFGGRTKGDFKPGSDIDLAIMNDDFDENRLVSLPVRFQESSLTYFTDVLYNPSLQNLNLKEQIESVGKLVYNAAEAG